MCGNIENFWIRTKFGVVLYMDPMIMIVETKRQKGKKTKDKKRNAKRQKAKNNPHLTGGPKGPHALCRS